MRQLVKKFMEKLGLRPWEWVLSLLAILLFVFSSAMYFSETSLRLALVGIQEAGVYPIGRVTEVKGIIRREIVGQLEFKSLGDQEVLYQGDTIVTGPQSSADS